MMTTRLLRVALLGKSGSGKSEVAKILSAEYACSMIKTGAICREISRLLFDNEDKRSTQMLDDRLTEIDESIFLRAALRTHGAAGNIVIDALRFQTDVVIARGIGCRLLRVTSSDSSRVRRLGQRGQTFDIHVDGIHRSEVELDGLPVDDTIVNGGDLEDLRRAARTVAQKWL